MRQESVHRHFPELFYLAAGNWKGDILAADVEELQNNATSQIYFKRPNSKEVIVQKEGDVFVFHCADFQKLEGKGREVQSFDELRQDSKMEQSTDVNIWRNGRSRSCKITMRTK